MNKETLDIIHWTVDAIIGIGILIASFPYFRGQYQKESNKLLRTLVDDQKKSIESLEEWRAEAEKKIAYLSGQVETLQTQKTDMEILVKTALKEHFAAHPDMAVELQGRMQK